MGKKYFEVIVAPVKNLQNDYTGGAVLMHDVTHVKELDNMKSEFLSVAAHQLRTPLSGIRWHLEMLRDGTYGDITQDVEKVLSQIHMSNIRLIELVNNLLDVSRIDQQRVADNPEETQIEEIIKRIIEEQAPLAIEKGVKLTFSQAEQLLPKVYIDPKRLFEVISNLVSNAIKYNNREKGAVVDIVITKKGDYFMVNVADNGMGLTESDKQKLFSKFFRGERAVKSETEGSGLGLYVVRAYVEGWGGKVTYSSDEGMGTSFEISIPLKPQKGNLSKNLEERPQSLH